MYAYVIKTSSPWSERQTVVNQLSYRTDRRTNGQTKLSVEAVSPLKNLSQDERCSVKFHLFKTHRWGKKFPSPLTKPVILCGLNPDNLLSYLRRRIIIIWREYWMPISPSIINGNAWLLEARRTLQMALSVRRQSVPWVFVLAHVVYSSMKTRFLSFAQLCSQ